MGDAGIGDHDIDRAEALFGIRDDGVCLRRVGDVEVPEVGTATLAANFVGDGVAFRLEHVGDDDMTVLVGEGQCRRASDANSSTRDQYDSLRHFDLKSVIVLQVGTANDLASNVRATVSEVFLYSGRTHQPSEMPMRGKRGNVRPPSMTMARPVTKSNSGEQTSATMRAISSSVTSRPSGVPAIAASL